MLRHTRLLLVTALVALLTAPHGAWAWSFKEHILVTRIAAQRLLADPTTPPAMKDWLREAIPTAGDRESVRRLLVETYIGPEPQGLAGLDWWVCFPDLARKIDGGKPVAPFGVPESPMHFLDVELLMPGDGVKQYRHDLSNKPGFEDIPRNWRDPRLVQAGYLPWRVEQVYGDLVTAMREGRLMPRDETDRDNALVLAGYLAHYLADNTQPQHATIDYRSRSYFSIPQRAPDVHGMLEWGMLDWEGHDFPELRQALWEDLAHLAVPEDGTGARQRRAISRRAVLADNEPWESTVRISLQSYDYLPLIGAAAQAASGQAVRDGDPQQPVGAPARGADEFDVEAFFRYRDEGRDMTLLDVKARQLSLAIVRIETMLRRAWLEAHAEAE